MDKPTVPIDTREEKLDRQLPSNMGKIEKATYEFEILVAADNARPCRRIRVKLDYDPESDELVFDPVNKSRYPWWARWPWLRSKWQD
jgi:hypothetical protein